MRILIAEHSGYCYGVKRAIQMLDELVDNSQDHSIYTLGPIIHNEQVTDFYAKKGVKIIDKIADISDNSKGSSIVVVRSHGAPESIYKEAQEEDLKLVDATCPYVKKIQNKVSTYALKGYNIIIVGDAKHPEVVGVNGWCGDKAMIVSEASALKPLSGPVCVVCQTTFSVSKWHTIESAIKDMYKDVVIFNTICMATDQRQSAAEALANTVELMIVIGGKHSSNTAKLVNVSSKIVRTIHVETKDDLKPSDWQGLETIGIVAGASTPDWIVDAVVLKIENEGEVFF